MSELSKMKSYRINNIMQRDMDYIKETLHISETAAIMWALERAANKLRDEALLDKS